MLIDNGTEPGASSSSPGTSSKRHWLASTLLSILGSVSIGLSCNFGNRCQSHNLDKRKHSKQLLSICCFRIPALNTTSSYGAAKGASRNLGGLRPTTLPADPSPACYVTESLKIPFLRYPSKGLSCSSILKENPIQEVGSESS